MAVPMSTVQVPLEFHSLMASSVHYNHRCQFICSFSINYSYLSLINCLLNCLLYPTVYGLTPAQKFLEPTLNQSEGKSVVSILAEYLPHAF